MGQGLPGKQPRWEMLMAQRSEVDLTLYSASDPNQVIVSAIKDRDRMF